jgi:hypothetical protein
MLRESTAQPDPGDPFASLSAATVMRVLHAIYRRYMRRIVV